MVRLSFPEITRRLRAMPLPNVELVVGIGSGGIIPAHLVAYKIGCEIRILPFSYRDDNNRACRRTPVLLEKIMMPKRIKSVLIVDDVAVSGNTLQAARKFLKKYNPRTLVLRGKADYVLFPEIDECVQWPWKT